MGVRAGEQPHVIYVVDWLPPDFGAVGQYAAIAARDLAEMGRAVRLIGLTSGAPGSTSERLTGGGVIEITRLHASLYQRARYLRRLAWTLRANFRLAAAAVRDPRSRRAAPKSCSPARRRSCCSSSSR